MPFPDGTPWSADAEQEQRVNNDWVYVAPNLQNAAKRLRAKVHAFIREQERRKRLAQPAETAHST